MAHFAETEGWGELVQVHDKEDEVSGALGSYPHSGAIVTIWWD